jgi:DNA polymerase family B, exonuclease domain
MSPTKRARFLLEEGERCGGDNGNVNDTLLMSTATTSVVCSPKRLRGGGGPSYNPYAKSNQKPSAFANNNFGAAPPKNGGGNNSSNPHRPPPLAADDEDADDVKPYFDAADVDDEDFMDEIQEMDAEEDNDAVLPALSSSVFSDITENIRQRWLRPPNQVVDNSQDLSLQWLDMDLLGGKPLTENPNETVENRQRVCGAKKGQVPIIRAYGVTEAGNSVTVFIHGYSPYGYFALPDGAEFEDTAENRKKIVLLLEQRLEGAARVGKLEKYCHKVEYHNDKKSIMGYETNHTKFLKITVAMPTLIPTLKRIMEDGIDLPGVSTTNGNSQYAAFECNVPFVLRFMIDREIAGAGWMTLAKKTYQVRDASKMQTHSQVRFCFVGGQTTT